MSDLVIPRVPRGFRDAFSQEVTQRLRMLEIILGVYERYGFEPLETPMVEFVEVLGKYLPDSDTPEGGIFAFRDDDGAWLALRYDLTAPLSRVVAEHIQDIPLPFRRYQVGPVFRQEKPGPGRFREFMQCDFDTVGTSSLTADAEACCVLADALEAVGVGRGDYLVKINDRKILTGVLEVAGLEQPGAGPGLGEAALVVLRAIDKLDRVGLNGVRDLLGKGRLDPSGDFTPGAGLDDRQTGMVMAYLEASGATRAAVADRLFDIVKESARGREGVQELRAMDGFLGAAGFHEDQVIIDPTVVRGLGYYTGPVFEAALTFTIKDDKGQVRQFGSVSGGGRYDDLVMRFLGREMPATGASIGVDRLLAALRTLGRGGEGRAKPKVLITALDEAHLNDYQAMAFELRRAGICAELYMGDGGMRKQLKYANRRSFAAAVIAGGDEFSKGLVSIKDLRLGMELSASIDDRETWRKDRPAQVTVSRAELVQQVKEILE